MTGDSARDEQQEHWRRTFAANPDMYGTQPSEPGRYAVDLFSREHKHDLLELGAGQGRDTFAFLAAGFDVTATDYASDGLNKLYERALTSSAAGRLHLKAHDVRHPLPWPDGRFDAVYSHMLFNMALSTPELDALTDEVRRVLRPDGLHVYTVRHVGDAHFGAGMAHGDGMFENGGFIVHFFDRALVDRLASGFSLLDVHEFQEGELPRKLWRLTLRKPEIAD
jgi:SAM-dependent methyltransferase